MEDEAQQIATAVAGVVSTNILSPFASKVCNVGLLGAQVSMDMTSHPSYIQNLRDEMIERRILRIEAALKILGMDVNIVPFPDR